MDEEEFYHMEEMALDAYMEQASYIDPLSGVPFNELPTLGEWLDS